MKHWEVVCKRWVLPKWVEGITLYPFIFYNGEPSDWVRKHERVHIDQIRKHGVLKFYILYLWYWKKYGYDMNPFEIEAYKIASPNLRGPYHG